METLFGGLRQYEMYQYAMKNQTFSKEISLLALDKIKNFRWDPFKSFITQFSVKRFPNHFLFSTYIVD